MGEIDDLLNSMAKYREKSEKRTGTKSNGVKSGSALETLLDTTGLLLVMLAFVDHEMSNNRELKFSEGFQSVLQDLTTSVTTKLSECEELEMEVKELGLEDIAKLVKGLGG